MQCIIGPPEEWRSRDEESEKGCKPDKYDSHVLEAIGRPLLHHIGTSQHFISRFYEDALSDTIVDKLLRR